MYRCVYAMWNVRFSIIVCLHAHRWGGELCVSTVCDVQDVFMNCWHWWQLIQDWAAAMSCSNCHCMRYCRTLRVHYITYILGYITRWRTSFLPWVYSIALTNLSCKVFWERGPLGWSRRDCSALQTGPQSQWQSSHSKVIILYTLRVSADRHA